MNGAELACGTIIHVEPADMNYKTKTSNIDDDTKSSVKKESQSLDDINEGGNDEDLDDFFASLE